MTTELRFALPLGAALLLGGCLEVDQHPAWDGSAYDGKTDSLPHERHYAGDRLAWNAAIGPLRSRRHVLPPRCRMTLCSVMFPGGTM